MMKNRRSYAFCRWLGVLLWSLPLVAFDDAAEVVAKLKAFHQNKPYRAAFQGTFHTENNGIPVLAKTESQVLFKDAKHLVYETQLTIEVVAMPPQPVSTLRQVHDGSTMWLDLKLSTSEKHQVLKMDLKNINMLRNGQAQLSFMPGKPGGLDPITLVLRYLDLFPFQIEKRDGDRVTLFSELPSLFWHQFGIVEPEGAKIDFSSVRLVVNRKTQVIHEIQIGQGDKAHMVMQVKDYQALQRGSISATAFRYQPPEIARVSDVDQSMGLKKPAEPLKLPEKKKTQQEKNDSKK